MKHEVKHHSGGSFHWNLYWMSWWKDGAKIAGQNPSPPYNHVVCDEIDFYESTWYSKKAHGTQLLGSLRKDTSISQCATTNPDGHFGVGVTFK